MRSYDRLDFNGFFVEIAGQRPLDEFDMDYMRISFNSSENFHSIVKRLARKQSEDQLKLAYAAIENEMARRVR